MKIKQKRIFYIILILMIITIAACVPLYHFNIIPHKEYYGEDFGIETIKSKSDYNNNGVDDYTDILLGARKDAQNKPKYESQYYAGGYPPENQGVCTDVVWRAFKNAGYSLKDMVDKDIKNNLSRYPRVEGKPDTNIDFRRVPNLKVFFQYNSKALTLDPYEIEQWQPGDIVIFGKNYKHIGIISDKRNKSGIPFIIHNSGQPSREEDALIQWHNDQGITGHYRFDGVKTSLN